MRIHILSDLHLEFAPFQLNQADADVVVLAGDVHTGKNGIKWILKTIADRPVIYVLGTHHAPSPQSVPAGFQKDQLNPAYASNLEPFIAECGAALWIHGHIHHRADFNVGTTRIVANPRGYPTEPHSGFDPSFVVEV